jgi:hypothetical protein
VSGVLPLALRVEYARLLWLSRRRRYRFTFSTVATRHTLERIATMSDNQSAPHEDTSKPTFTWECSDADRAFAFKIADRAVEMGKSVGVEIDRTLAAMDVLTVHTTTCPLNLWQLLASDADDFAHDFTGIGRFIDRRTGHLGGGFKPRFAKAKQ